MIVENREYIDIFPTTRFFFYKNGEIFSQAQCS